MSTEKILKDNNFGLKLKFLISNSFVYGLASSLNAFMLLLLFPMLARELGVENFGLFDLIITVISAITILFIFGQDSAVARFFYDSESHKQRSRIITTSLLIQCVFLIIGLSVISVASYFFLTLDSINLKLFLLALIQLPCFMLINFSQNILKWTFQRNKFLIVSLGNAFCTLLLAYLFVSFFNYGVIGGLSSFLISRIIFAILGLFFTKEWIDLSNFQLNIGPIMRYAAPYGLLSTLGALTPVIERSFIGSSFGSIELGYYAAATKVAMFISVPIYAFQTAWGPFFLALFKSDDSTNLFRAILLIYTSLILFLVVCISMFGANILEFLVGSNYTSSYKYIALISFSLAVYSIASITSIGIDIAKKSIYKLYANVSSFIIFFLSIFFLQDFFNEMAIVYSLAVSSYARYVLETAFGAILSPIRFGAFFNFKFVSLFFILFLTFDIYILFTSMNIFFFLSALILAYLAIGLIKKS